MIKIENLIINYGEHQVINNCNLDLFNGQLTILKGESGSGKSSILNFLSLDKKFLGQYHFYDNNLCELNEEQQNDYREKYIAYVNQFNSLIIDYSILDNLEYISIMRYGVVKKEMIDKLLTQFKLSSIKRRKVKRLSGGEKQRLAIACAILKDAELYLFDEPTSMLDISSKELIIEAINQLVKSNKIVVVATHEDDFFEYDCMYLIENNKVSKIKDSPFHISSEQKDRISYMNKVINMLCSKYINSQFVFIGIMIMVLGFCMGSVVENIASTYASLEEVAVNVQDIYNQEIYVVNDTVDDEYDYNNSDSNLAINIDVLDNINDIDGVVSVEPFAYFPMSSEQFDQEGNFIQKSHNDMMTMVLKKDDQVINEILFGEAIDPYTGEKISGISSAVFAHYPHQKLKERCDSTDEGEGIYISYYLANKLGITELNNYSLVIRFTVPIASIPGINHLSDTEEEIFIRGMFNVYQEKEFKIIGILSDTQVNTYTYYYQGDIYMSKEMMDKIQSECLLEYEQIINLLASKKMRIPEIAKYCNSEIYEKHWDWSSAIVVIDDYSIIDKVCNEIEQLDENINANKVNYYGIIEDINDYDTMFKSSMTLYIISIGLSCFLGVIVIKIFRRNARKNDYIYLRRNGLSNKDLLKIEFKEAMIEAILVSLVGVFVSYIKIANRSHILANMGLIVEFNIGTILSVVSISFAIIYFATWIVSRRVIKND